ncbi:hypothetical protein C8R46DRAFT_304329 [Mycena filopes]|nr:hypothetical protein C8R46DRAFT_304329 [Mycena filopes]
MFSTQSYRSPVPTTAATNPREKYLAAVAEAKAAEAEYLAAERLQQEEDALRTRLEQIQALKAPQAPSFHYQPAPSPFHQQYYQSQPQVQPPFAAIPIHDNNHFDLEQLRSQIAAQERVKLAIEREEKQQRALRRDEEQRAIRRQEAQRKERDLARRERVHAQDLAAQRASLEALTQSVLRVAPKVRFAAEEAPSHHVRPSIVVRSLRSPHRETLRQCRPHVHAHAHARPNQVQYRQKQEAEVQHEDLFGQLFGHPQQEKSKKAAPAAAAQPLEQLLQQVFGIEQVKQAPQPKPKAAQPAPQAVDLGELLQHVFGAKQATPTPPPQPKTQEPAAPQSIDLGELLQRVFGAQTEQTTAAAVPKVAPTQHPTAAHTINLSELLQHVFGASGAVPQPQAGPSGTKQTPPAASQSAPAPAAKPAAQSGPAPTPAPAAQSSASTQGCEHFLNHFLGGHADKASAPNQVDMQQLMSMFLGGPRAHSHAQPQQQASSSKVPETSPTSCACTTNSSLKTELEARRTQSSEERDLEEAIRMSLAEAEAAPPSPTTSNKGKAPAPAPVKDASTSAAEVAAIDAAFKALADEFVFPAELDFGGSSSRSASPARSASPTTSDSASPIARLSYSARNQPVRFYHQALSGLLGRLDAVESFGDEGVRKERKEVVGRVEGALDEVEKVVEGRWRKVVGREERREVEVDDEAVVVSAEDASEAVPVVAAPEASLEPAFIPEIEAASAPAAFSVPEPAPVVVAEAGSTPEPSSYSPSAAESVETLRAVSSTPTPAPPAPSDSDIDTFLLPATDAPVVKKPASKEDEAEVGSDWSEVDA